MQVSRLLVAPLSRVKITEYNRSNTKIRYNAKGAKNALWRHSEGVREKTA